MFLTEYGIISCVFNGIRKSQFCPKRKFSLRKFPLPSNFVWRNFFFRGTENRLPWKPYFKQKIQWRFLFCITISVFLQRNEIQFVPTTSQNWTLNMAYNCPLKKVYSFFLTHPVKDLIISLYELCPFLKL